MYIEAEWCTFLIELQVHLLKTTVGCRDSRRGYVTQQEAPVSPFSSFSYTQQQHGNQPVYPPWWMLPVPICHRPQSKLNLATFHVTLDLS
jgi:hypothetical protein